MLQLDWVLVEVKRGEADLDGWQGGVDEVARKLEVVEGL